MTATMIDIYITCKRQNPFLSVVRKRNKTRCEVKRERNKDYNHSNQSEFWSLLEKDSSKLI